MINITTQMREKDHIIRWREMLMAQFQSIHLDEALKAELAKLMIFKSFEIFYKW